MDHLWDERGAIAFGPGAVPLGARAAEDGVAETLGILIRADEIDETVRAVAAAKTRWPRERVTVEIDFLEASELRRLLDAGADAFLAIGAVPPTRQDIGDIPEAAGLTAREVEVLGFLSAGYSNKEVARRLDVSVRTIETHRFNLRRKTRSGRLKDLVRLAHRMGLPSADEIDARPASLRA